MHDDAHVRRQERPFRHPLSRRDAGRAASAGGLAGRVSAGAISRVPSANPLCAACGVFVAGVRPDRRAGRGGRDAPGRQRHPGLSPPPGGEEFQRHPFPWWGWVGVFAGIAAWVLAWTRWPWFAALQPHTFSPLWAAYIVVVNALCCRRTGRSLLTDRPLFFLGLFPASAAFWWGFEYLNRFVQNWYYAGPALGPWDVFLVRHPAVCHRPAGGTVHADLVHPFTWVRRAFGRVPPLPGLTIRSCPGRLWRRPPPAWPRSGVWPVSFPPCCGSRRC